MNFHLTKASRNSKLGPMPVSTSSAVTCPDSCPLKSAGCYADAGPVQIHWRKVTSGERGVSFAEFVRDVRRLPDGMWRYGQAGDLPGEGDHIDEAQMTKLVAANRNRKVIAYTHKPLTDENTRILKDACDNGFHVNVSCESFEDCDTVTDKGLAAVVVLPLKYQRGKAESLADFRQRIDATELKTPAGVRVAICPATYMETTCQQCGACAKPRANSVVIGFPAHGTSKKKVDALVTKDRGEPQHLVMPGEVTP